MRFYIWIFLLTAFIVMGGCAKSDGMPETEKKENREVVPVEVSQVQRGSIQNLLQFNATLETENAVKVFSRVEGIVMNKPLEEGTFVKKNSVLLRLDGREQKLSIEKAKINYLMQQKEFERIAALFKKELVSKDEYDKAKLTLDQMRVEYESAKLRYDYTEIRSPISGIVSKRLVNIGDHITSGMQVFEVVNFDEKIAKVYIPEGYLSVIKKNIPAIFTVDALRGKNFDGYVKRISPTVDPASGTFKVTVAVKDRKNILKPGMFVNIMLVTDVHKNALFIPKTALVFDNDKAFFYTVKDDSIASRNLLRKGFEDNRRVEVMNEVEEGEKVIVVGQSGLKDGALIKIVTSAINN
jgi:membrane fusion protein (multidrug efflux system)